MMVSTKGRYALRVMIDLAEHQSEGYVPLKEIAARQEISEKYLESILKVLVQQRFLEGLRGKGGGYKLTRAPETYTVGSILRLTEGSLATVACLEEGAPACPRMAECRTYPLWYKLDGMISEYLDSVTLADLMQYPDVICAFGLASAAPRSPYRHLELCGIAIKKKIKQKTNQKRSRCAAGNAFLCSESTVG